MTTNYYTVDGRIIGESTNGVRTNYLPEALGNVTATVDESGAIINQHRYKPYGSLLSKTGVANDPRFMWFGTHSYSTGASQLISRRSRDYSPQLSIWSTAASNGALNAYELSQAPSNGAEDECIKNLRLRLKITEKSCSAFCTLTSLGTPCICPWLALWYVDIHAIVKGCSSCGLYQWVEKGGGWIKDSAEGWPYPWSCGGEYGEAHFCNASDSPRRESAIPLCYLPQASETIKFVTCVCCDEGSICYSWELWHNSGSWCNMKCNHSGPTFMGIGSEAKSWCAKK